MRPSRRGWKPVSAACSIAAMALLSATAVAQVNRSAPQPGVAERLQRGRAEAVEEAEQKAYWQDLYRTARAHERSASERLAELKTRWKRERHNEHLRGDEKTELLAEIDKAEKDLERAREERRSIPERARQAGAPPGWLRAVDLSPAAPAAK